MPWMTIPESQLILYPRLVKYCSRYRDTAWPAPLSSTYIAITHSTQKGAFSYSTSVPTIRYLQYKFMQSSRSFPNPMITCVSYDVSKNGYPGLIGLSGGQVLKIWYDTIAWLSQGIPNHRYFKLPTSNSPVLQDRCAAYHRSNAEQSVLSNHNRQS
jgi:hypothetical protein